MTNSKVTLDPTLYTESFAVLAEKLGISKALLSHRAKKLGTTPLKRGRKGFFTLSQVAILIGLDNYLKENPNNSIDSFFVGSGSINALFEELKQAHLTDVCQFDGHLTKTEKPVQQEVQSSNERRFDDDLTNETLQELVASQQKIIERFEADKEHQGKLIKALSNVLEDSQNQALGWRENYYLLLEQYKKAVAEKEIRAERWCLYCQNPAKTIDVLRH